MPFTLICSTLSCLFLGCGLLDAEVLCLWWSVECVACSGGILWVVVCCGLCVKGVWSCLLGSGFVL